MFDPISASKNIKDEYVGYIATSFHIANREYADQFREALQGEGEMAKGPYLDVTDSYKAGKSLEQLIEEGEASPLFRSLEGGIPDGEKELQIERPLYLHQEAALRQYNQGRNMVVTTGTGSGKTECFLIPVIDSLLREAEAGTLSPGVRAIIIYPMNALANDQMKRFRALLKNYPDITFGVYNSSTRQGEEDGIAEYGKVYKDEGGYPLKPLENEVVSRDRMQEAPPHILVTNYAMLEYMMLRPKDDLVFSRAKLRFLILDEAHVYRGATGMETSLLLRRLKARISDPARVMHILTSATLGGREADDDIVKFAETLCGAAFDREDIIRAQTAEPAYDRPAEDVPLSLFADLADPKSPVDDIARAYGLEMPQGMPVAEFLYDVCVNSSAYRNLRKAMKGPMTIPAIAEILHESDGASERDVVNIISVASQASKNKTPLIRARYHMFARAMEGAFITIGRHKRLMLSRKSSIKIGGEEWKVFEGAACDDCGRIAVVGREADGRLEFADRSNDQDAEYYLLCDEGDGDDGQIGENDFLLCAKCGAIIHASQKGRPACDCGIGNYVRVRKADETDSGKRRCPNCAYGKLGRFYIGYDAATAVLGTSLFEEIPESEKVLKSRPEELGAGKGLFGGEPQAQQAEIVRKKRQFLAFSDNRGEAAFFASYMTSSYKEFLRRRGILHVAEEKKQDMAEHPWEIGKFVDALAAYFDENRTFAEPGESESVNLTATSERNAWIAVLNEMVNARRSTSLVSLGMVRFEYKGNTEDLMKGVAEKYGQSARDAKALFDLLVMDILHHGAIEGECNLKDDDREYIFYSVRPKRVKRCRDLGDKGKNYILGWSTTCTNGKYNANNSRLKRVMRVLGISDAEANELLQEYWDQVLRGGEAGLTHAKDEEFYFKTDRFVIGACTEDVPIYECDVCGKTSMINCRDMCTTLKCGGKLRPVTHEQILEGNHYASLYKSSLMQPLHIKEHTAQLGREEQRKYQEEFVNKEINALSCSTTFEMGVDVGDLETVYLRDMPPSPANYVQRAGRAGRSRSAAAYTLTYAKLSSHDFTYYKRPEDMITGKIGVPVFEVKNEKIILRHIFAVALSDFFASHPDVYDSNNADALLNGDGWERLCDYLEGRPAHLREILEKSIPEDMHEVMGISDDSWIERLIGEDGVLKIAVDEFRGTVQFYKGEMERLREEGSSWDAYKAEVNLKNFRRGKDDKGGKNGLIEFLARNNVLPKYGFPVDTVELYQNANAGTNRERDGKKDGELRMSRDLQLAISEYAPGSQVVADGKLYTSRYIRKQPGPTGQDWEIAYVAKCGNPSCQTWNHRTIKPGPEGEKCVSCKETIERWERAIEPRKGFIADAKSKDVTMRMPPEKAYRSDDCYIGDKQRHVMQKYEFEARDGKRLLMETSTNDSLMAVCNNDFYVCPRCGYAESVKENWGKKGFNSNQKKLKRKHDAPWGRSCDGMLEKHKLCHVFKTDVVRLVFPTPSAERQDVMLSVMYALLEALSLELDIERGDISGCLHKVSHGGKLIYSIVLYDTVAGGAGHVRRLATEDGEQFGRVVDRAIKITGECSCSPSCYSCLRNYYNQKVHDLLNREYACEFLKKYAGKLRRV